jgi:hypothetical protein
MIRKKRACSINLIIRKQIKTQESAPPDPIRGNQVKTRKNTYADKGILPCVK